MEESKQENKRTGRTNPRKKTTYSVPVMFYKYRTMLDQGKRTSFYDKNGYPLVPIYHELKTANIQSSKHVEDIVKKRVYRDYEDKRLFQKLLKDLITDPNIQEDLMHVEHYIACIIIYGADGVTLIYRKT